MNNTFFCPNCKKATIFDTTDQSRKGKPVLLCRVCRKEMLKCPGSDCENVVSPRALMGLCSDCLKKKVVTSVRIVGGLAICAGAGLLMHFRKSGKKEDKDT